VNALSNRPLPSPLQAYDSLESRGLVGNHRTMNGCLSALVMGQRWDDVRQLYAQMRTHKVASYTVESAWGRKYALHILYACKRRLGSLVAVIADSVFIALSSVPVGAPRCDELPADPDGVCQAEGWAGGSAPHQRDAGRADQMLISILMCI
jgi:pentatricopeptide repeat protein